MFLIYLFLRKTAVHDNTSKQMKLLIYVQQNYAKQKYLNGVDKFSEIFNKKFFQSIVFYEKK